MFSLFFDQKKTGSGSTALGFQNAIAQWILHNSSKNMNNFQYQTIWDVQHGYAGLAGKSAIQRKEMADISFSRVCGSGFVSVTIYSVAGSRYGY
jgi:hypothetical protein